MTKKQQAFLKADIPDRVRLAADVAREIATRGLSSAPDDGLIDHEDDQLVINWIDTLAGSQCDRLTDHNVKITADWADIEHLAGMAYSLGVAVGLRLRLDAFEGSRRATKSQEGGR